MTADEYAEAIADAEEQLLHGTSPVGNPKAIVLAGQPGAGKSKLKKAAVRELANRGGVAPIDPDDLRRYHPRYAGHAAEDYRTAATKVQKDAAALLDDMRAKAIDQRRNLIIDGTLLNPDRAEQLCRDLKSSGYEVDVRAVAVSERKSQLRVAGRLERALNYLSEDEIPRDVPEGFQKKAYEGVPHSLDRVEQAGVADRIAVYRSGETEQPLYENRAGIKTGGDSARAVLEAERNRPWTASELRSHAAEWDEVADLAKRRGASPEEQAAYEARRLEAKTLAQGEALAPKVLRGLETASKVAGKAALPLAAVGAAADLASGIAAHDPERVAGSIGETVGGIGVGAAAGALAGAETGPGALLTGLAGGVAGGILGREAAKHYLTEPIHRLMGEPEKAGTGSYALKGDSGFDASTVGGWRKTLRNDAGQGSIGYFPLSGNGVRTLNVEVAPKDGGPVPPPASLYVYTPDPDTGMPTVGAYPLHAGKTQLQLRAGDPAGRANDTGVHFAIMPARGAASSTDYSLRVIDPALAPGLRHADLPDPAPSAGPAKHDPSPAPNPLSADEPRLTLQGP